MSSWSAPSHASTFTGELPSDHGVHAHNIDFNILEPRDTFLSDLDGYRTVGVSTNLFAGPAFGFDTLFETFPSVSRNGIVPGGINIEAFHHESTMGGRRYVEFLQSAARDGELSASLLNGLAVQANNIVKRLPLPRMWDYGARSIARGSRKWLDEEPVFFFANFMDAHPPYEPALPFDNSMYSVSNRWSDDIGGWTVNTSDNPAQYEAYLQKRRELYFASIDYLDRRLDAFIDDLQSRLERETTVIVTADHGENLGYPDEDYRWGHVGSLSDALLHVPLYVYNPPEGFDHQTSDLVSHLDLGTLVTAMARDEYVDIQRDVVPAERIGLGLSEEPNDMEYWDRAIRCAYDGDYRYEWDSLGETAKYHITEPSSEKQAETSVDIPERLSRLFATDLGTYKRGARVEESTVKVSESTREGLRELGYL